MFDDTLYHLVEYQGSHPILQIRPGSIRHTLTWLIGLSSLDVKLYVLGPCGRRRHPLPNPWSTLFRLLPIQGMFTVAV